MREFHKSRLVLAAGELWDRGTTAEFLSVIADGTLPEPAFQRWLVQDYLFAQRLTTFQAVTAGKSPRGPQKLLIEGLCAMDAELDWFESVAADRHIDLEAAPHATCRRYGDFLIAAAYAQSFEVLLAILYGVEVSYLVAWSRLTPRGPYAEFIERWSNQRFTAYVRGLLDLADRHPHPDQQARFNETLRHEADFWRMTWEG